VAQGERRLLNGETSRRIRSSKALPIRDAFASAMRLASGSVLREVGIRPDSLVVVYKDFLLSSRPAVPTIPGPFSPLKYGNARPPSIGLMGYFAGRNRWWCRRQDSNLRPADYETAALTT
jgi:hypothetical protein